MILFTFFSYSISIVEILEKFPKRRLTQSKMGCIKDFVETELFRSPKCRAILLPVFCKHIKDHLESNDEVCSILVKNSACATNNLIHRKLHFVYNLMHRFNLCVIFLITNFKSCECTNKTAKLKHNSKHVQVDSANDFKSN